MSEEKNMMAEANEETAQATQSERVIDLGKPYKFEGHGIHFHRPERTG